MDNERVEEIEVRRLAFELACKSSYAPGTEKFWEEVSKIERYLSTGGLPRA